MGDGYLENLVEPFRPDAALQQALVEAMPSPQVRARSYVEFRHVVERWRNLQLDRPTPLPRYSAAQVRAYLRREVDATIGRVRAALPARQAADLDPYLDAVPELLDELPDAVFASISDRLGRHRRELGALRWLHAARARADQLVGTMIISFVRTAVAELRSHTAQVRAERGDLLAAAHPILAAATIASCGPAPTPLILPFALGTVVSLVEQTMGSAARSVLSTLRAINNTQLVVNDVLNGLADCLELMFGPGADALQKAQRLGAELARSEVAAFRSALFPDPHSWGGTIFFTPPGYFVINGLHTVRNVPIIGESAQRMLHVASLVMTPFSIGTYIGPLLLDLALAVIGLIVPPAELVLATRALRLVRVVEQVLDARRLLRAFDAVPTRAPRAPSVPAPRSVRSLGADERLIVRAPEPPLAPQGSQLQPPPAPRQRRRSDLGEPPPRRRDAPAGDATRPRDGAEAPPSERVSRPQPPRERPPPGEAPSQPAPRAEAPEGEGVAGLVGPPQSPAPRRPARSPRRSAGAGGEGGDGRPAAGSQRPRPQAQRAPDEELDERGLEYRQPNDLMQMLDEDETEARRMGISLDDLYSQRRRAARAHRPPAQADPPTAEQLAERERGRAVLDEYMEEWSRPPQVPNRPGAVPPRAQTPGPEPEPAGPPAVRGVERAPRLQPEARTQQSAATHTEESVRRDREARRRQPVEPAQETVERPADVPAAQRAPRPLNREELQARRLVAVAAAIARAQQLLDPENGADLRRRDAERRLLTALERFAEWGIDVDDEATRDTLLHIYLRSNGWYRYSDRPAMVMHSRAATGELAVLLYFSRRRDPNVARIRFLRASNTERTPDIEVTYHSGERERVAVEVRTITQADRRARRSPEQASRRTRQQLSEQLDTELWDYRESLRAKLHRGQLTQARPGYITLYMPFGRINERWLPTWRALLRDVFASGPNEAPRVPPGVLRVYVLTGEGGVIMFDLENGDLDGRVVQRARRSE